MLEVLIFLRFKHLLAHILHNYAQGPAFFADHEFLSEFYAQAESQYDSVIERMIGLGIVFDPIKIQEAAVNLLRDIKLPAADNGLELLKAAENELCAEIDELVKSEKLSQGTIQLLGDIANQAEMNLYKIGRRLGG
jgi:DNA-binding ferritin-like protein